jgi:hypothetical protein
LVIELAKRWMDRLEKPHCGRRRKRAVVDREKSKNERLRERETYNCVKKCEKKKKIQLSAAQSN